MELQGEYMMVHLFVVAIMTKGKTTLGTSWDGKRRMGIQRAEGGVLFCCADVPVEGGRLLVDFVWEEGGCGCLSFVKLPLGPSCLTLSFHPGNPVANPGRQEARVVGQQVEEFLDCNLTCPWNRCHLRNGSRLVAAVAVQNQRCRPVRQPVQQPGPGHLLPRRQKSTSR